MKVKNSVRYPSTLSLQNFLIISTCLFLLCPIKLHSREFDCDQYLGVIGVSLVNHRIPYTDEQIYGFYKESLLKTMEELNKGKAIFTSASTSNLSFGLNADDFRKCRDLNEIFKIYSNSSEKKLSFSKILEIGAQKFLNRLDPHSNFFPKQRWNEFNRSINGKMRGIGVSFDAINGTVKILKVYRGSPAEGILFEEDVITEINGTNTSGLSREELSPLFGLSENVVTLKVSRGGEIFTFKIEKREFTVPSVEAEFIERDKGILHLTLSEFSKDSPAQLEEALTEASRETAIRGLILDLRFNPGGMVDAAKKIEGIFSERRLVASMVKREGREDVFAEAFTSHQERDIPMVILLNDHSASASELLSLSLKDYERAIIMGTSSFGKGTGQSVFDPGLMSKVLNDEVEVAVALTTFQFYSPLGHSPQRDGVAPHVMVKDAKLEQKHREIRAEAKLKGETVILRETDYDNPLPPNTIGSLVESNQLPTNRIEDIVRGIESDSSLVTQISFGGTDDEKEDVQLKKAVEYLAVYTERCLDYRLSSCRFSGGTYASR